MEDRDECIVVLLLHLLDWYLLSKPRTQKSAAVWYDTMQADGDDATNLGIDLDGLRQVANHL